MVIQCKGQVQKIVYAVLIASSSIVFLTNLWKKRRSLRKLQDGSTLHPQVDPVVVYS